MVLLQITFNTVSAMKVYKVELLVITFDELCETEIVSEIENVNYPNDCLITSVMNITGKEIGQWSDDNPLNKSKEIAKQEFERLFKTL
jgi:hypothetical protein